MLRVGELPTVKIVMVTVGVRYRRTALKSNLEQQFYITSKVIFNFGREMGHTLRPLADRVKALVEIKMKRK